MPERIIKQRIRDPLHDLIEFDNSQLEETLWRVIQTPPFQRLRRIKQLGFSDLVFPGATHSRFSHSLGVFHTARQLIQILKSALSTDYTTQSNEALAAALVHDIGHGAFSHAFEEVGKRIGGSFKSHEDISYHLIRNSVIKEVFTDSGMGSGFADDVANIIKNGATSPQHAIVSSQFDADRLDYMRRDRLMTGTKHAAIDFTWLIANLKIGKVHVGSDEDKAKEIETFVIGPKAIHAAEAYILGLFHLYPTVYFHKTTRGAELLFIELLYKIVTSIQNGSTIQTGLSEKHPLVLFAKEPDNIDNFLNLDDSVVWGALSLLAESSIPIIKEFSSRLKDRKLLKCIDIRKMVSNRLDPENKQETEEIKAIDKCCLQIEQEIKNSNLCKNKDDLKVLFDKASRSPYKILDTSANSLERIYVKFSDTNLVDLATCSSVVSAIKPFQLFRVYVRDDDKSTKKDIDKIVAKEIDNA